MRKLVGYFIDNSFIVNLLSILMLLLGTHSLFNMKRDLISNWSTKTIIVSASIPGATPSSVEKYLTYPIEQTIKNIPGIEKMTSVSNFGYLSINIDVSDDHKDIPELEQKIKDAIDNIRGTLPSEAEDIKVEQIKMTESWFSSYAITGFLEEDSAHQRWFYKLKEKLQSVSGVARISDTGNQKNIYIQVDPKKIQQYQVSLKEVYSAIQNAFTIYPIGRIEKGSEDIFVEFQNKEIKTEEIKQIIIRATDPRNPLTLGKIANVEYKLEEKKEMYFTNGKESLYLTIFKDVSSDTIALKEEVEKLIKLDKENAPSGIDILLTGDGPSFIERQINALKSNALFGVILVLLTLMVFLGFKTSLMTSFGLPLSYMFTFFILENLDIKIDLISIVGMLLVLGILVDDAIVISEQYTQNLELGLAPKEAAIQAVEKTWIPICGAVSTTIIAFLPLLLSGDGLSDIMFAIPVVVMSSLAISLFESFFILPNHLVHFVKVAKHHEQPKFVIKTSNLYTKVLSKFLKLRYITITGFVGLFIFSMYFAYKNIPTNFNLNISSEKVKVTTILKEAKDLKDAQKQLEEAWAILGEIDKSRYEYITMTIGSDWSDGEEKTGPQYASFTIRFSQLDNLVESNKKYVMKLMEDKIEQIKKTPLADRFERLEAKVNFDGIDNDKSNIIDISISSTSPFNVEEVSQKIKNNVSKLEHVTNVEIDNTNFTRSWTFTPNKAEVFSHGLSLSELALQVKSYVAKTMLYESLANETPLKIYAYSQEELEHNLDTLGNKTITLPNGQITTSSKLGQWMELKKEKFINHENLKRIVKVSVTIDKDKANKEILVKNIEESLKPISEEEQFKQLSITTKDADEQAQKNKSAMLKNVILAIGMIYFILAVILRSTVSPFIICSAIPFGLIGIIWAFYFQNLKIDVMAIIGIIAMAGVVVNDSLLLVDTVNKNKEKMKKKYVSISDLIDACLSRLRPILLTSITTLGGVFPMAYGIGGDAGFTKPLAMSMGWGLLFSTGLTLIFIPCLVLIYNDVLKTVNKYIFKEIERDQTMIQANKIEKEVTVDIQDLILPTPMHKEIDESRTIQ